MESDKNRFHGARVGGSFDVVTRCQKCDQDEWILDHGCETSCVCLLVSNRWSFLLLVESSRSSLLFVVRTARRPNHQLLIVAIIISRVAFKMRPLLSGGTILVFHSDQENKSPLKSAAQKECLPGFERAGCPSGTWIVVIIYHWRGRNVETSTARKWNEIDR